MEFAPRHALITGAAGAIGGALAQLLHDRHAGLRLSLVDKDAAGLADRLLQLSPRATALPWDLAQPATLGELWQRATATHGPVDLLVNCAGLMEVRSFSATAWELGERLLDIDLVSPLRLMQLAVANMTAGGHIVNVSSMAGRVPMRGYSYYAAAKSGLGMASEIAALDLAPRGISVLTVYPGPVRSPLEARARAQLHADELTKNAPVGEPAELARRIERALRDGRRRLVYPAIYYLPDLFVGLASFLARLFSPLPTDAP